MSQKTFTERVSEIQKTLKAPKSQYNSFGKYNYRNQEDILEAVKQLLNGLVLTVSDEMVEIGGRIYVKSTATITDGVSSLSNSAYAREADEQKGMNPSQVTGSTSSYARKYCLNGLFLIDDTKDADSDEVTAKTRGEKMPEKVSASEVKTKPSIAEVQSEVGEKAKSAGAAITSNPAQEQTPVKTGKAGWGRPKTQATQKSNEDLY